MTRRLVALVWLTLVWVSLWESFTVANLAVGVAVAALATMLVPLRIKGPSHRFRPLKTAKLAGYFGWKLIQASVQVAWEIATPRDRTAPAIVHVPLHTRSPGIVTAVANMVSLTPGTLTLEVDRDGSTLFIHVLHFTAPEATTRDVHRLEQLTIDAFPLAPSHSPQPQEEP